MARRSPFSRLTEWQARLDHPPSNRARKRWHVPKPLLVLLLAVAILALALLFAQDQETLRIESPLAAADPAFPDYVAALTGSGVTRGDEYQILTNGVQILPAMLEAIHQAKRRIGFEIVHLQTRGGRRDFTPALVTRPPAE